MEDLFVVHTLDELKALAEPLRVRMLEALMGEPQTVKQVAERLEEKPTKLYHHVELMEAVGLIKKVKSQKKRGTVETYYQAAAHSITLDPNLLTAGSASHESVEALQALFTTLFESTLVALRASLQAGLIAPQNPHQKVALAGVRIEATAEQLADIHAKLKALLTAADKTEQKGGPLTYNLTVAFFPVQKSETKPPSPAKRSRK
ncbi:MAG: helix-turn-helix domain-containing protein [Anaerolineae bacterium]